jgi:hypothetical protein
MTASRVNSAGCNFGEVVKKLTWKVPEARGWGLCSGIEQIWEEHVLDGEATLR